MPDLDFDAWDEVIAVNLKSVAAMARFALPTMISQHKGAIVNIGSIAGVQAFGGDAYGPSKAALIALTKEIAVLHGHDGMRANVVLPGHVHTTHVGAMLNDA